MFSSRACVSMGKEPCWREIQYIWRDKARRTSIFFSSWSGWFYFRCSNMASSTSSAPSIPTSSSESPSPTPTTSKKFRFQVPHDVALLRELTSYDRPFKSGSKAFDDMLPRLPPCMRGLKARTLKDRAIHLCQLQIAGDAISQKQWVKLSCSLDHFCWCFFGCCLGSFDSHIHVLVWNVSWLWLDLRRIH